jgi:hypothetical protein
MLYGSKAYYSLPDLEAIGLFIRVGEAGQPWEDALRKFHTAEITLHQISHHFSDA